MLRRTLILALLLLFALPAHADDPPALEELLTSYLTTTDPVDRMTYAFGVLAASSDPARIAAAVPGAWRWPDDVEAGEPLTWTRTTPDGKEHTIYAYAPESYTADRAWPVLVWLHGGVARPSDGGGQSGLQLFAGEANEKGFLLLSPSAQEGSEWWTPSGEQLIRDALGDLARWLRADLNRVAVAGFSDGGSGCFHLLAHDPDPYACFLAFMGNPLVSRLMGGPTWASNVPSLPVYAVNGETDRLYPAERMRPFMEELQEAGGDVRWFVAEGVGHEISGLAAHWEDAYAFWMDRKRDVSPRNVDWASSSPDRDGRRRWVEILEVDDEAPAVAEVERPMELVAPFEPRPRLGIRLDLEHEGPGLMIEEVEDETPAAEAGFIAGDIILRVGETDIAGPAEITVLRDYLEGLEEDGTFTVRRGDEELVIETRPRVLERDRPSRPGALGYDRPVGRVHAQALEGNRIDLQSTGVRAIRLHLAEPLVDFGRELVVRWNGKTVFAGPPPQDASYLLAQAARNGPGAPVYRGSLEIRAPVE
ncbi:MAG: carboxylesterase family protein [Planctomycetota bacterium]|jgi:poly(3-hydroxybutyrate) depolymerase